MNNFPALSTALLAALILTGCSSDNSGSIGADTFAPAAPVQQPNEPELTAAQAMLESLGPGAKYFSEASMQALLDYEDNAQPVALVQVMVVDDAEGFTAYERSAESHWTNWGGETVLATRVANQLFGERPADVLRIVQFPDLSMLLQAMSEPPFTDLMEELFTASSGHTWVLGSPATFPFKVSGGFVDPSLQDLDQLAAEELLRALANESNSDLFKTDQQILIDMLVSDSPEPFFMLNLVDFYEQAKYPDGRDPDLTGIEANQRYSAAVVPLMQIHNSGPEFAMPVGVVLTNDDVTWEQVGVGRYASRDAFLNIFALNPSLEDVIVHKEAGVENTRVYFTEREDRTVGSGPLFNQRYCEILLVDGLGQPGARADVYGTQGVNGCPQASWETLAPGPIAREWDADVALMNGPRYSIMDSVGGTPPSSEGDSVRPDEITFGELRMRRLTSVLLPVGGAPGETTGYQVAGVERDNIWIFYEGRRIYELIDPEGTRWVMQARSQAIDPDLQLEDLQFLGERLALPDGWSFDTRILEERLEVPAINGVAEVVQDEYQNTYQRVP